MNFRFFIPLFFSLLGLPLYGLEWVEDCTKYKEQTQIDNCTCRQAEPIISGKYQSCGRDSDCHLLADRCGGWVTFNKLYLKEMMWIVENPKIFAAVDTRPAVVCFRNKCIKVEKKE